MQEYLFIHPLHMSAQSSICCQVLHRNRYVRTSRIPAGHIRRCDGPGLVGGSKTNKVLGVTYGRKPPCAAWRDPPEQPARFQDPTHNVTQVRQKGISKKGSIENEEFSILRRLIIQPSALRDARRIYPTAHTKTRLYVLYMKASSKAF